MEQPARILIIERDRLLGARLEEWLVIAGHLVTHVRDARHATAEPRPDILLADIPAAPRAARELVAQLRCRFPGTPIVAMVGERAADAQALELGIAALLRKRFDRDALLNTIRRVGGTH